VSVMGASRRTINRGEAVSNGENDDGVSVEQFSDRVSQSINQSVSQSVSQSGEGRGVNKL